MPRRLTLAPHVAWLRDRQDGVLTVQQATSCGYTRGSVQHLVDRGRWQRILPGVLLTQDHSPTRRQRTFAAALWAGPSAAIDGACACIWHGIDVPEPADRTVHLVVPYSSNLRSTSYVRIRRSAVIVEGGRTAVARYVDAATALVVA